MSVQPDPKVRAENPTAIAERPTIRDVVEQANAKFESAKFQAEASEYVEGPSSQGIAPRAKLTQNFAARLWADPTQQLQGEGETF